MLCVAASQHLNLFGLYFLAYSATFAFCYLVNSALLVRVHACSLFNDCLVIKNIKTWVSKLLNRRQGRNDLQFIRSNSFFLKSRFADSLDASVFKVMEDRLDNFKKSIKLCLGQFCALRLFFQHFVRLIKALLFRIKYLRRQLSLLVWTITFCFILYFFIFF